ncbi:MAG: glycoside hydrolase family 15 protein [Aromatoleum sp.]|nr:glycoside hydrolase family 15 protein [Aromatoleum sp.]
MRNLDLALVGNGRIGLLVDPEGTVVWGCFPRFDGDATFCALLDTAPPATARGLYAIELVGSVRADQEYVRNTAVLVTRLYDAAGGAIEITDCAPRFLQFGRVFQPTTLVRRLRRLAGNPRVVVRLRPASSFGSERPATTVGSNHIRYVGAEQTLRLTTDGSLTAMLEERSFLLDRDVALLFGADETAQAAPAEIARRFIEETTLYWRQWTRSLAIPFEWQGAVIRAALTLQQNAYDDTGAIIAAMTTSIPEAPDSGRNWDYRYCWLRDSYFVVDALNRLSATETMEGYLGYVVNVAAGVGDRPLQPVYRINGDAALAESAVDALPGYRGMGPVRIGNDAHRQIQNDVYGSAILAATHVFFDERLTTLGDAALFERLEGLGRRALAAHDQPDAGLWELRGAARVHTFSSVMCWAACDRLARIAARLALPEREASWRAGAERIRKFIDANCWNERRQSFVASAGGDTLDASMLLLADLGFLGAGDPRFAATVGAIERELKRGDFIFRYVERDDFGEPAHAFIVCTFWYVNALAALGRRDEARALFERLLACRNRHGLLAEHLDTATGEQWGNFVQTYSMVGLITAAIRLSRPWDAAP